MQIKDINLALQDYDSKFFEKLEPVLEKIAAKSKALASNLKECITKLQENDRYLRASQNQEIATKESELTGEEFDIFRKYVRLLRSCTIMCGHEVSNEYKKLFIDFFSGTRLKLARDIGGEYGTCKNEEKEAS